MKGARYKRLTTEAGVPVLWVRATAYGHSTARRFIGMIVFAAITILPGVTRGLKKPDVVVGSTVHLLAAWAGLRLARRHRVPFVFEIRDVWPDSLVYFGKLRRGSALAKGMEWLSSRLARSADLVLSPLPMMDTYLRERALTTDFLWVSNGVAAPSIALHDASPPRDEFTFMYLGALNRGNAIDGIIDAFARTRRLRPDVPMKLRLVGSGPQRDELVRAAEQFGVSADVVFEARIPEIEVIARAREADCLVANLRASPLYSYGVSLNKLYMYMSAARPIIFGNSGSNDPVAEAEAGISVPGDDREAMSVAMSRIINASKEERREMGESGRRTVLDNYTYDALAGRLANGLNGVIDRER